MKGERHAPTSTFAMEIAGLPGGDVIERCVQCGICTASCEVANVTDQYRPRRLIQKILLGKRDEVLQSEIPWLCMTCRMCEERCQEGISPAEVFHVVRGLAAKEGYIPDVFKSISDIVLKDGWLLADSYSDFNEDDREELGLNPDLKWNDKFVKTLKKQYFGGS